MVEYLCRDAIARLLTPRIDGLCWWCQARPATTGEHKYKHSELKALLDAEGLLFHGTDARETLVPLRGRSALRRDRYGLVKFEKSMCGECNNARSQPFDRAYDMYAGAIRRAPHRCKHAVDLRWLYGATWEDDARNLARYFVKHFACRFVRSELLIPRGLRNFLDGDPNLLDVGLNFVRNDSLAWNRSGLTLSPDTIMLSEDRDHITQVVMAAYTGQMGVRFCWVPDAGLVNESQFFNFPLPTVHRFTDTRAVEIGQVAPHRRMARLGRGAAKWHLRAGRAASRNVDETVGGTFNPH